MNKKTRLITQISLAAVVIIPLFVFTIGAEPQKSAPVQQSVTAPSTAKVTFVELGSVNCIPCKMMQTVMKNIETKYPKDVKVVFYDVWTPAGEPAGKKYGIRAIPTQVFLDASGKEYYRHEGFFPQDELEKVLFAKGAKQ